jgi:hypothetical protein
LTLRLDFDVAATLLPLFPILEGLLRGTAEGCDGQAILVPGRQDSMNIELIDIDLHSSGVADEASVYALTLTMMPVLLTHLFHLFLLGIS